MCKAIKDGKRLQAHSNPCRSGIEASLKATPQRGGRPGRRSGVMNKALEQELERSDKWKSDSEEKATASSSPQEMRETRFASDFDAKRRNTMKSSPAPSVLDADVRKQITMIPHVPREHKSKQQRETRHRHHS